MKEKMNKINVLEKKTKNKKKSQRFILNFVSRIGSFSVNLLCHTKTKL